MEAFVARNPTLFKKDIKESTCCGACNSQNVDLVIQGSLLFLAFFFSHLENLSGNAISLSWVLYKQSPLLCGFMLLPSSLSKMLLTFTSPNTSI